MRSPLLPAALALLAAAAPPAAGAEPVRTERPFALLAARGDATTWTLHPAALGAITAEATWSGGERLTLALAGPGGDGHLTRESGPSPLVLRFLLTPELLQADGDWRLTLFNFSGSPANGQVAVTWPGPAAPPAERPRRLHLDAVRVGDLGIRVVAEGVAPPPEGGTAEPPAPPPPAGSGEPRRSVLPDGRVRLDYPDGSAVIYELVCGKTQIAPDGRETRLTCHQVQGADLPPPPGDPGLGGFLDDHGESLLQQIRFLVGHDAAAIANYLAVETDGTATVVERIDLRRRYVDRLLGLGL